MSKHSYRLDRSGVADLVQDERLEQRQKKRVATTYPSVTCQPVIADHGREGGFSKQLKFAELYRPLLGCLPIGVDPFYLQMPPQDFE